MKAEKKELDFLIMKGLKKALSKLLKERIKNDDYLIISDGKGNGIKVKAKDCIKASK